MNTDPLLGARLKAIRAKSHIRDLNREIGGFIERHPYCVTVEAHHKPGCYALRYRERETIPASVPLIIGDAVHNLRTSLDHLACALVAGSTGTDARNTSVNPIRRQPNNVRVDFGITMRPEED